MKDVTSSATYEFIQRCQVAVGLHAIRDLATSLPAVWTCLLSAPRPCSEGDMAAMTYAVTCIARKIVRRQKIATTELQIGRADAMAGAIARLHANELLKTLLYSALDHEMSLRKLAANVNMSYCHVSRLLTQETGVGFHVHLHGLRVLEAVSMLATTELSIKEVAFGAGYSRVQEFYRHFQPYVGLTPQRFVRMLRAMPPHLGCATAGSNSVIG